MYCECCQSSQYFSLLAYTSVVPSCRKATPSKVKVLQMGSKWGGNWQLYFLSQAGRLLDYTFPVPVVATCVFHNLCNPSQGGIGGKYHLGAAVSSLTGPVCGVQGERWRYISHQSIQAKQLHRTQLYSSKHFGGGGCGGGRLDCFHIFCAYKVWKKCDQVHMQYELADSMFKINFFFLLDS